LVAATGIASNATVAPIITNIVIFFISSRNLQTSSFSNRAKG
jgi:hypothetical protein